MNARLCAALNGATVPTCNPTCQSAADCGVPQVPAYDPSHYTCTNSLCEYTGCKSVQECMSALMKPATCK